jgi:phage-related protein (TIGR01555 family)
MEDIKDAVSAKAGVASLIQEANVDVIKREGLSDELTTEDGANSVLKRYQLAGTMKSINRMLLLDGTESYERNPASFGGLGDILQTLMEWTSGAADIPMTRLFGVQSKGIGDSGEGDLNNYYDGLRGHQESAYRDVLEQVDEVMIRSWLGYMPDECEFEFNPLSQPNGNEAAQQKLANSQADVNYHDMGVVTRSQIMRSLQSGSVYPIGDQDIVDAENIEQKEAKGVFDPDGDDIAEDE